MKQTVNVNGASADLTQEPVVHDQLPCVEEVHMCYSGRSVNEAMTFDLGDVPDETLQNAETGQLPSVEEARINSSRGLDEAQIRTRRKRLVLGLVGLVLVLALAIGLSVGLPSSVDHESVPSEERLESVMNFLVNQGVSDRSDLETPGTPQQLAATFIAKSDADAYPVPTLLSSRDGIPFVQRYVLAVFFHALGGNDWEDQLGFLGHQNVCKWNARGTSRSSGTVFGAICDAHGQVVGLHFCKCDVCSSFIKRLLLKCV